MYQKLLSDFARREPSMPKEVDLELGLAIKQIRLRMGMTQEELAQDARIKPNALKTLENGYARFTKTSNLNALSRALRISPQEILLEAREWFSGNFFAIRHVDSPEDTGRRKKRRSETWLKKKAQVYNGFQVEFVTPALDSPAQFYFALIEIQPGKAINELKLPYVGQVAGFVQRGSLRIIYGQNKKEELDVFGNQGFSLQGDKQHDFINADKENPLRLFVAFPAHQPKNQSPLTFKKADEFSIANMIENIRSLYSPAKDRKISYRQLSSLTGLDEKSLCYLAKTKSEDQVIYWDKIEKIAQALGLPFSKLLELGSNQDDGDLQIATAHDRAVIDYKHYHGVQIKSVLAPSPKNTFHMAEVYIDPKKGMRRGSWKRTDPAMMAIYIEDGDLRVEVGKNRKTRLKPGESLYFDGSLGYILTNPLQQPCKFIMATYPAIVF